MNTSSPIIIGVSGIAGAGKSTIIKKLAQSLQATALFWDDFDAISKAPDDYVSWYMNPHRSYDEWLYNDLADTLKKLKSGQPVLCPATGKNLQPTKYILFDAPLGYCHKATSQYIDFLVCLDTPPDIALARRLVRVVLSCVQYAKPMGKQLQLGIVPLGLHQKKYGQNGIRITKSTR
jgi:uridine kinase